MTKRERADMLIKTVNVWRFMLHCDQLFDNEDDHATEIVSGFFANRSISIEQAKRNGVLPLTQLMTSLGVLYMTLFYASTKEKQRWIAWMKGPQAYDIRCSGPRCPRSPDIYQVICALRNAAAHEFDDDNDISICFPKERVVAFHTIRGVVSTVTFCTRSGLAEFLEDFVRAVQRMALQDTAAEESAR